jgi:hypothetical protein
MMLTYRYQRWLVAGVMLGVTLYLLLPLTASYLLAQGLRHYGYQHVIIQLGYPGWRGMRIPVVSFQQDLGNESLMISLTDAELRYRLLPLLRGHIDRVVLPYVAVQILNTATIGTAEDPGGSRELVSRETSPWSLLTAGDLLRRLPILPFDELELQRVHIFREQATGPLRKVTISGLLVQNAGELGGHLSFQGQETAAYGLTVTGHSASTWSAMLVSQRPQAAPIISWQSHAQPNGPQIHMEGRLEVNVRELAPFIALLVPIGPELGKVTGQIAMRWTGTAAVDATLADIWDDPQTQMNGQIQARMTLPALEGVAKDLSLAGEGTFIANATQVGWTLNPGVLVTATVNAQPQVIPEVVRAILPRGDQPVRIAQTEPVQGTLYWGAPPYRITAEGPIHVSYGITPGPLAVEFVASHAEGIGRELVSAEGTFRAEGELPKGVTDMLSAKEATGGLHGTLSLLGGRVEGAVLPSSSLTIKQLEQGTLSISRVTLQLADALPMRCELASSRCSAGPASVGIRLPSMQVQGREARLAQGTLVLQQAEAAKASWNVQATLHALGVTVDLPKGALSPTDWKVQLAANEAGVKADVRADAPAHGAVVTAAIEQSFRTSLGSLHAKVGPVTFDTGKRRFSRMVTGLPVPFDLTDGQFTATVDLSWSFSAADPQRRFRMTSAGAVLTADALSGHYRWYAVNGLSTTARLHAEGTKSITMLEPTALRIASIATGVEVTNVGMTMQAAWKSSDAWPVIDLKDIQCGLFGGAATSPGVHLDWTQPSRRITFSLRNLDLGKILSVEQQKDLQGTGLLNGTLPITMTASGLTVEDGVLEAQPPGGVFRYASVEDPSKVITESDSHLRLVGQALTNFHYTVLRVRVQYAEAGALDLSVRLEGRNPDLKTTPPIHVNLTVQEHVPTLLKSLRLVQDIEEALQMKANTL